MLSFFACYNEELFFTQDIFTNVEKGMQKYLSCLYCNVFVEVHFNQIIILIIFDNKHYFAYHIFTARMSIITLGNIFYLF